jgi:YfiH family protein
VRLTHPLLEQIGVEHGFGLRGAPEPPALLRPRQVHGRLVVRAADCRADPAPDADAVVSNEPGTRIGVVTADCVPILCASSRGDRVAAIHAGWRGLAQGVVAAGVDALRRSGSARDSFVAVIGPHIGPCCYEVDEPVLDALRHGFGDALQASAQPTRPGHARIDLGALVARALESGGLAREQIGHLPACCTRCDARRFHSYRRDGAHAGRMLHHIAARLDRPEGHG